MKSYWVFSFKLPGSILKEIERLFSNFNWNNKMHAWNWRDLCKFKSEGGCGIRRLIDISQASGVRLVWRLCTSNSLWAHWIRKHYLQDLHISQAKASLLDLETWKWICSLKSNALPHMLKLPGDGCTTSQLYDRWMHDVPTPLISLMAENTVSADEHKWAVSDIVHNGQWILRDQALLPIWDHICLQEVPGNSSAHNRIWDCTNSGSFNFKSSWDLVRDKDTKYKCFKMLWFPSYSPKMAICLIRALNGKLLTRDFLKNIAVADSDTCVLCRTGQEFNTCFSLVLSLHSYGLYVG